MEFGHWEASLRLNRMYDAIWRVNDRTGRTLALIINSDENGRQRAKLMAAAPELLAACREALSYVGSESKGETQDQLRAAIAKAVA